MTSDPMKLHSFNVSGNLHDAVRYCNTHGLAEHVLTFDCCGPYTVVALRAPASVVHDLRSADAAFAASPNYDDPRP